MNTTRTEPAAAPPKAPRRTWVAPEVKDLPRLTDLTLQTGGGIDCGVGVCP